MVVKGRRVDAVRLKVLLVGNICAAVVSECGGGV